MSATMTAPMPSLNGSTLHSVTAATEATSLRQKAAQGLAMATTKFKAAWAWFVKAGKAGWASLSKFFASHATIFSMGAAGALAIKGVWQKVATVATSAVKYVAKAATAVVSGVVHVARKIVVGPIAWLTGMFSKTAAAKLNETADRAVSFVDNGLNTINDYVVGTKHVADAVLTADTTSAVVNIGSAALVGTMAVNLVASGAVAGTVAGLPVVGTSLALAIGGGMFTFIALGALIVAGVINTLVFNKAVDLSITKAAHAEPMVIKGEVVQTVAAEAPVASPVAQAETVLGEVVEQAAAVIDPEIAVVGLEAYQEQTAAMVSQTEALEDLAEVVVNGRTPAGKRKGRK